EQLTVDLSTGDPAQSALAEFEAAWQGASRGGSPPALETYLAALPEPARAELRRGLERVEQEDHEQRGPPPDTQVRSADSKDPGGTGSGVSAHSAPTLNYPDKGPPDPGRTVAKGAAATGPADPNFSVSEALSGPANGNRPVAVAGYEVLGVLG